MLITHDMGVIAETADRVMVMYQGRVLETGPVRQVLDAPQQPYTQVLMGAIPSVHHRVQRLPVPEVGGGPAAPAVPWQPGAGAQEPAAALLEVRDLCKEFDLSSGWLARLLAREDKRSSRPWTASAFRSAGAPPSAWSASPVRANPRWRAWWPG